MSHDYSEDKLIEQTCIDIFQNKLGWETINAQFGETFGEDGTLGRLSEADVILRKYFFSAITKLNPKLPAQAYQNAFELIAADTSSKTLAEINQEKYHYLKEGIPVTYKNEKGEVVQNQKLKIFDFDNADNNHFLAVQQLWIEGKSKRRKRPDVIGFVNGIPLLFIELKAHHKKLKLAYEQNFNDYKDTIPHLFHCNAFIVLSNGLESKIGAITSKFQHFHEWKRIVEEEEGKVSLDTIIRGVCDKSRFIDLFENFILYDTSVGSVVKLIARNHQFIGVNKAIEHFKNQNTLFAEGKITEEEKQKLGVFWHTQGSGKSYSMVFICEKIHRKFTGSFTFLIVTDRKELDKQIYGTFAGVGAVNNKKLRAASVEDLKGLLKQDNRYAFTLIQKFQFDEEVTKRDNIIVIGDEVHRTNYGSLAVNMRKSLRHASFMGFTGTPLFKDDEITRRIFGDYVSKYNFRRSVEDGATVPLYYENRGEKLQLVNPQINQDIRNAIEDTDADSDQEDKLKKMFAQDYPILTAKKRLRSIAKDLVEHFNTRGYKGKAMLVCIDKVTAVKMFNYVTEEWDKYIAQREKETDKLDDLQEQLSQKRDLIWTKETEIAVIVSSEQNEIDKFRKWGLDIEPHRDKMNNRDLEKDFKDENHPFRLAIVCAMWITGFDVPSLSTIYIDKPMKSHTLMQTIARANRVFSEEKNNGLIVDYIETYKALLEALAIYAGGVGGGSKEGGEDVPLKPIEELVKELQETIDVVNLFLKDEVNFVLQTIVDNEGLDKLEAIKNGVDAVYTNDETKNKFGVLSREVFKKYKALMPKKEIYQFKDERDAINAIYATVINNRDESDITELIKRVQDVVDSSVENMNIALEPTADYGKKIDLSGLDFELLEKEFIKTTAKRTLVQSLKTKIEIALDRMLNVNPLRIDFYEKYQEIIDEYNRGKDMVTLEKVFQELKAFVQELSEEQSRAIREGLTDEELAVFDLLRKEKKLSDKEKNEVKDIAKELLNKLKEEQLQVEQWFEKMQTSAAVRQAINDYLFNKLPYPTYEEKDIALKTDLLFDYFRGQYNSNKNLN